ncbi:AraC family transcriptional regulator [Pedobacter sp. PWIIR3]
MKPQHLTILNQADHSFSIRKETIPNINNTWHYHQEIELICFHKGSGTQFIGDHIKSFAAGDIVLVGKELPHYWRYDNKFLEETDSDTPYSTVIHFMDNFMGEKFLHLPEAAPIKFLLEKAKNGILITGDDAVRIAEKMEAIYLANGLEKILALLNCLLKISGLKQLSSLSSIGFKYDLSASEKKRLNNIYNFVLNNFRSKILLEQVAEVADLVPNSFCRYFKKKTGKTFSQFLIDVRIGYARKLIIENQMDIKQICFESGFNNFSCFHKQFKSLTGTTPKDYMNVHLMR